MTSDEGAAIALAVVIFTFAWCQMGIGFLRAFCISAIMVGSATYLILH